LLAATRITQQNMEAKCSFEDPKCDFTNTSNPDIVYVADIERYTVNFPSFFLFFFCEE